MLSTQKCDRSLRVVLRRRPAIYCAPQVLKNLESSLQHYNVCLRLYNPDRYPRRWGVAALEMGMTFGLMADLVEQVRETAFVRLRFCDHSTTILFRYDSASRNVIHRS